MKKTVRERGKAPMHLTLSPVMKRLAVVLDGGSRKPGRGPFNFRRQRVLRSDMIDGTMRHLTDAEAGLDRDRHSGEDPLLHAMARLFVLLDAKHHGMLVETRVTARPKKRKAVR